MHRTFQKLAALLKGDVYFDEIARKIYSIDASIFQMEPLAIVVPRCEEDILQTLSLAQSQAIPLTVRGAATGITGACLGEGIIVDISKYMNRIIEINREENYAICEPGVIQNQLNMATSIYGLQLGPDTSTGDRATIGGMVGNNAAGAHSICYGKMSDHVLSLDVLTASCEKLLLGEVTEKMLLSTCQKSGDEGRISRLLCDKLLKNKDLIKAKFPRLKRRVSGYNLDLVNNGFPVNMANIFVGSEGTLGIASRIKLNLVKSPKSKVICLLQFLDFKEAFLCLEEILSFKPDAVEMMDKYILEAALKAPFTKNFTKWIEGLPQVVFAIEFNGFNDTESLSRAEDFKSRFSDFDEHKGRILIGKKEQGDVWKVRKAGLGLLMSKRSHKRAVAFLEDVAVPPEKLGPFIDEFEDLLKRYHCEAGIYGHAGAGCLHIRPMIDLRKQENVDRIESMMRETAELLRKYGGALSGEHGDGLVRSWLNKDMFGDELYDLFKEVKSAFDPQNLMNPGKIIANSFPREKIKARQNLKLNSPQTFYNFADKEGWAFAVDMCNGNGSCRSRENSLMCPSFNAFGDERHSTRARAQTLHAYFSGALKDKELADESIHEILDLCIECKGCKTQCPSQVDMAKMKAEYLWHYYKTNKVSLRARLFSNADKLAKLALKFPSCSNALLQSKLAKIVLEKVGFTRERTMPTYAEKCFTSMAEKREKMTAGKEVVLWADCYTEFNHPQQGLAAVTVLEALGFKVIIPPFQCCGRPAISQGLLEEAMCKAEKTLKVLQSYCAKGVEIIGLEPGCIWTLIDEYPELSNREDFKNLAQVCFSFEDFLARELANDKAPFDFNALQKSVSFHVHCHQKSLSGSNSTRDIFEKLGISAQEIDAGCCGMAGTFGYEKEHHEFSQAIAAQKFYPALAEVPQNREIIASGMSCRAQMQYGSKRQGLHIAEFLAQCIEEEDHGY